MNIIDTRANKNQKHYQDKSIKNIPLFQIKGITYSLGSNNYKNIIFQSIPSVEFFNDYEYLKNKDIYSMGSSTKNFLLNKGIGSICPNIPGSSELIKLLSDNKNDGKYLIVKGENGLSDVFNYLNKKGKDVQELICYTRFKFNNYDSIKKDFFDADAVIFSSTYAVEIFFKEIYSNSIEVKLFGISNRIVKFISDLGYEATLIDYFSEDISESIKKSI